MCMSACACTCACACECTCAFACMCACVKNWDFNLEEGKMFDAFEIQLKKFLRFMIM